MDKKELVKKLKGFDAAFSAFRSCVEKEFFGKKAAETEKGIASAVKTLSSLSLTLNVKYICMPKGFRLRLNRIGFEKLLDSYDNSEANAFYNEFVVNDDESQYRAIVNKVMAERVILDMIIKEGAIESYEFQFD